MTTAPIRVYHGYCGWRSGNAGDCITAPLVQALGGVDVRVMAEPEAVDLFGSGSLLDGTHPNVVPSDTRALVWGTGMLSEWSRFPNPASASASARFLAVRGPLTWARCGRPDGVVYGDPGLLVARAWPMPAAPKRYRLGIIPHYVDAQDDRIAALARRHPDDVIVIDVCGPLKEVLRSINECEAMLSSSLHGLVFADSYGVPNAWVRLSDKLVGGGFKFRDYYAAIGKRDPMPIEFTGGERIEELQARCAVADANKVQRLGDSLVAALRIGLDAWQAEPDVTGPDANGAAS